MSDQVKKQLKEKLLAHIKEKCGDQVQSIIPVFDLLISNIEPCSDKSCNRCKMQIGHFLAATKNCREIFIEQFKSESGFLAADKKNQMASILSFTTTGSMIAKDDAIARSGMQAFTLWLVALKAKDTKITTHIEDVFADLRNKYKDHLKFYREEVKK